jgi:hypothetical protein
MGLCGTYRPSHRDGTLTFEYGAHVYTTVVYMYMSRRRSGRAKSRTGTGKKVAESFTYLKWPNFETEYLT